MKRTLTALAVVTALGVTAGPASAAKNGNYSGTTDSGNKISFKVKNNRVKKISGLIPTTCVPAGARGGPPMSGSEMFTPPGSFAIDGKERRRKALQDAAMHYSKVTKNYRVRIKRGRRGSFKAKLHVNFSFQTLTYSSFSGHGLMTWICQGDDSFSAR